jgi:ribosomal protein S12 methylthiotransferase
VLPYLDMPMQHASDTVLARMRRPERQRTIREKVSRVRIVVPDVAIRTTCIVGFPGETDEDFQTLLAFLEETQFDRVGAFTYSPQEGTRAAELDDDVPEDVKRERLERLNELQRLVSAERNEGRLGRTVPVLIDRVEDGELQARSKWQADDIDGVTFVRGGDDEPRLVPGAFVEARLDEVIDDVDFDASFVRVLSPAPVQAVRSSRALPVVGFAQRSIGSFGR